MGLQSWTFRHPDFHADRRHALENIKRKVPAQRKAQQQAAVAAAAAQVQVQAAALALPPLSSIPNTSLLAASTATNSTAGPHLAPAPTPQTHSQSQIDQLELQVRRLREEGDDLRGRLRTLEKNYDDVLVEFVAFQKGMAQQDGLIQNLMTYFLGNENGQSILLFFFTGFSTRATHLQCFS